MSGQGDPLGLYVGCDDDCYGEGGLTASTDGAASGDYLIRSCMYDEPEDAFQSLGSDLDTVLREDPFSTHAHTPDVPLNLVRGVGTASDIIGTYADEDSVDDDDACGYADDDADGAGGGSLDTPVGMYAEDCSMGDSDDDSSSSSDDGAATYLGATYTPSGGGMVYGVVSSYACDDTPSGGALGTASTATRASASNASTPTTNAASGYKPTSAFTPMNDSAAKEAGVPLDMKKPPEWNDRFQMLLDMGPCMEKYNGLKTLSRDFVYCAEAYGKIIISEQCLPHPKKTVSVANVGGIAGGEKYICQGILYKFAIDFEGIYRGDEGAAKAAGHEIRGLMEYLHCGISGLHCPLMALIDYRGFRLVAVALLPIGGTDTLIYGSADAGRNTVASVPELNAMMKRAGEMMNVKGHRVGLCPQPIYGPGDIEVHHGRDGKYYVLDYARYMPSQPPVKASYHKYLYQLLRPEFVRSYSEPLNPDAFSRMNAEPPSVRLEDKRAVARAYKHLITHVIPQLATALEPATRSSRIELSDLSTRFHADGVNMRQLGLVRMASTHDDVRLDLLMEAVCRVVKCYLREAYRERMKSITVPSDQPFREVTLEVLNLTLSSSPAWKQRRSQFWQYIRTAIAAKFPGIFSEEECSPTWDLREATYGASPRRLRIRLAQQCSFVFSSTVDFESSKAIEVLVEPDVQTLLTRAKHINMIDYAEGMSLIYESKLPQYTATDARRLLELAEKKLTVAHRSVSTNNEVAVRLAWVRTQLVTFDSKTLDSAVRLCENVLKRCPTHVEAVLQLARTRRAQSKTVFHSRARARDEEYYEYMTSALGSLTAYIDLVPTSEVAIVLRAAYLLKSLRATPDIVAQMLCTGINQLSECAKSGLNSAIFHYRFGAVYSRLIQHLREHPLAFEGVTFGGNLDTDELVELCNHHWQIAVEKEPKLQKRIFKLFDLDSPMLGEALCLVKRSKLAASLSRRSELLPSISLKSKQNVDWDALVALLYSGGFKNLRDLDLSGCIITPVSLETILTLRADTLESVVLPQLASQHSAAPGSAAPASAEASDADPANADGDASGGDDAGAADQPTPDIAPPSWDREPIAFPPMPNLVRLSFDSCGWSEAYVDNLLDQVHASSPNVASVCLSTLSFPLPNHFIDAVLAGFSRLERLELCDVEFDLETLLFVAPKWNRLHTLWLCGNEHVTMEAVATLLSSCVWLLELAIAACPGVSRQALVSHLAHNPISMTYPEEADTVDGGAAGDASQTGGVSFYRPPRSLFRLYGPDAFISEFTVKGTTSAINGMAVGRHMPRMRFASAHEKAVLDSAIRMQELTAHKAAEVAETDAVEAASDCKEGSGKDEATVDTGTNGGDAKMAPADATGEDGAPKADEDGESCASVRREETYTEFSTQPHRSLELAQSRGIAFCSFDAPPWVQTIKSHSGIILFVSEKHVPLSLVQRYYRAPGDRIVTTKIQESGYGRAFVSAESGEGTRIANHPLSQFFGQLSFKMYDMNISAGKPQKIMWSTNVSIDREPLMMLRISGSSLSMNVSFHFLRSGLPMYLAYEIAMFVLQICGPWRL